jgi:cyclopropane fatty-acyl-phospholipid synthase-like methyltransferase
MSIHKNGYWEGLEATSQHVYDQNLSNKLVEFYKSVNAASIVDLGCGLGDYVKHLKNSGLNADGFDGNPNTPELTQNICGVLDLSEPVKFDEPYDWVMSLEVGEHLPKQFEDIFINNLHNNNKSGIILSWAVEGQGGHGHVNTRNNDYIKSKFAALGYLNDVETENKLRESALLSWFKNTIMVFKRSI